MPEVIHRVDGDDSSLVVTKSTGDFRLSKEIGICQPGIRFPSDYFSYSQDDLRAIGLPDYVVDRHTPVTHRSLEWFHGEGDTKGPGIYERNFASPDDTYEEMAYIAITRLKQQFRPSPGVVINGKDGRNSGIVMANFTMPQVGEFTGDYKDRAKRPDVERQLEVLERIAAESNLKAFGKDSIENAACAGFAGGVLKAEEMLEQNPDLANIVILTNERFSDISNFEDTKIAGDTSVLFGDFATASVLTREKISGLKLLGGRRVHNYSQKDVNTLGIGEDGKFYMQGKRTFMAAVKEMSGGVTELLGELNKGVKKPISVDKVLAHQANARILEAIADKLKILLPIYVRGANTSASTIPRLIHAMEDPELRKLVAEATGCSIEDLDMALGQIIAMTAIGAGVHVNTAMFEVV